MKIEMFPVDKPVPYALNAGKISRADDRGSVLPFESDSIPLF
jgi:hypothetical protein